MALAFVPTDCFSSTMEAITPLDDICPLDCQVEAVPDIVLDPDQRDILFPPVTPNQNVTLSGLGGCRPVAVDPGDIEEIGSDGVSDTDITASSTTWHRTAPGGGPVSDSLISSSVTELKRMAYEPSDGVSTGHIYAFFRTTNYDTCGNIHSIGPEVRKELAASGPCPEETPP